MCRFRLFPAMLLAMATIEAGAAQAPRLNLTVVEGEGAINNIRQRTARPVIVQVEDENHKPVAGASVAFILPSQGAGGEFTGAGKTLVVTTNANGQASTSGFVPNALKGKYQIRVSASYQGQVATGIITQSNAALWAVPVVGAVSTKALVVLSVVAGAAVAGGTVAAVQLTGNDNNKATISAGAGGASAGPPR